MAKPIEPTPPLMGDDARALAASLAVHASPDEMRRRVDFARAQKAQMMAPKPRGPNTR